MTQVANSLDTSEIALRHCPSCGRSVTSTDHACPRCKEDLQRMRDHVNTQLSKLFCSCGAVKIQQLVYQNPAELVQRFRAGGRRNCCYNCGQTNDSHPLKLLKDLASSALQ